MHPSVASALALTALLVVLVLLGALIHTTRELTRLRRRQALLHPQARISHALLSNPALGLIVADPQGLVVSLNPAAEQLLGFASDQAVGRLHTTAFYAPEEMRDEIAALFRDTGQPVIGAPEIARLRLASGEDTVEREWMWVRQDQSRFPVSVMVSALTDEQGRFDGFLLTFRDISQRRRAEQLALTRQRLIEHFVLHTPASIALLDHEFNFLAASQRWLNDLHIPATQIVGTSALEHFHPHTRRWRDILEKSLAGATLHREEDTLTLSNGTEVLLAWECRPWLAADGSIGGVTLFFDPLAAKRQTQRRLQVNERRLRSAQSIAQVGSWDCDLSSRVLTLSDEAYRLLGLPTGIQVTLEQLTHFVKPSVRPIFASVLNAAINQGKGWDLELEVVSAQGQPLWLRQRAEVELKDGKPAEIHCTLQDITERKGAEQALARAKEAALHEATQKAEFLAHMSHELRTPLNAVIGMISLLAESKLDHEQRDYVETVRTASGNLLSLINDVLDFSKIESGKLVLDYEPFSLQECLDAALDLVALPAREKNLELWSWVDPLIPAFQCGDLVRLRQVIVNLLANAVKFTPHGEIFVTARLTLGPDGRQLCHVTVRDTGIGIRPERIPYLFNAYTQAEPSTHRTYGGTGLGLAICRRLVELMQGRIWVESEHQRGARFHFEIPLHLSDRLPPDLPYPSHLLRGKRVLVIDDHPTAREVLQLHLESWGAVSHPAATPLAALALLRRGEQFDAVLVDHTMPIMDGLSFAQHARELAAPPPLFLLSEQGRKAAAAHPDLFSAVLAKPLRVHQLRAALSRHFLQSAPGFTVERERPAPVPKVHARLLVVEPHLTQQSVLRHWLEATGARLAFASTPAAALRQLKHESFDFVLASFTALDQPSELPSLVHEGLPLEQQPVLLALVHDTSVETRDACLNAGFDGFTSPALSSREITELLQRWLDARPSELGLG